MFVKSLSIFSLLSLLSLLNVHQAQDLERPAFQQGTTLKLSLGGDVSAEFENQHGKIQLDSTGKRANAIIEITGTIIKRDEKSVSVRCAMANEQHPDGARFVSLVATVAEDRINAYSIPKIDDAPSTSGWMIQLESLDEVTIETWKRIRKVAAKNGGYQNVGPQTCCSELRSGSAAYASTNNFGETISREADLGWPLNLLVIRDDRSAWSFQSLFG